MRRAFLLLCLVVCAPAWAAENDDESAALGVADAAAKAPAPLSPSWLGANGKAFVELAAAHDDLRGVPIADTERYRVSGDVRLDTKMTAATRLVVADRLDVLWQSGQAVSYDRAINTWKESYVGYGAQDAFYDVGRINEKHGVGFGYNPSDFFRRFAVVSRFSDDPSLLRENRLGVVAGRAQWLWEGGSASALYAPEITQTPHDSPFAPGFDRTNENEKVLLQGSVRTVPEISIEGLAYKRGGGAWQPGLNLTDLFSRKVLGRIEWIATKEQDLVARSVAAATVRDPALEGTGPYRSRLAANLTYTTEFRLSVSLEYQYDGTALDRESWNALSRNTTPAGLALYGQVRQYARDSQDNLTRSSWFANFSADDVVWKNFNLSGFVRYNPYDDSRYAWLRSQYNWEKQSLALLWTHSRGRPGSEFGALPTAHSTQLIWTSYF